MRALTTCVRCVLCVSNVCVHVCKCVIDFGVVSPFEHESVSKLHDGAATRSWQPVPPKKMAGSARIGSLIRRVLFDAHEHAV